MSDRGGSPPPVAKTSPDIRRYCIVTLPRCGSNYLGSWIGSHKNVSYHSEMFHRRKMYARYYRVEPLNSLYVNPLVIIRNLAPFAFIEKVFERSLEADPDMAAFGFKLFVYHYDRVLRGILADARYSIVFLHRDNKLAQYGSYKLARKTRAWTALSTRHGKTKQVTFDPAEFDRFCGRIEGYEAYLRELLQHRPFLDIEYRDIDRRRAEIIRHIGGGAEVGEVEPSQRRLNKQHAGSDLDRFSNPEVVLRHLDHTPYAEAADLGSRAGRP